MMPPFKVEPSEDDYLAMLKSAVKVIDRALAAARRKPRSSGAGSLTRAPGEPERSGNCAEEEVQACLFTPRVHRLSHSITWSARCRSDGGIVRPSALAVLRLITSSKT